MREERALLWYKMYVSHRYRGIYIVTIYTGHFWPANETAFHLRADSGLRPYAQPAGKSFFKMYMPNNPVQLQVSNRLRHLLLPCSVHARKHSNDSCGCQCHKYHFRFLRLQVTETFHCTNELFCHCKQKNKEKLLTQY